MFILSYQFHFAPLLFACSILDSCNLNRGEVINCSWFWLLQTELNCKEFGFYYTYNCLHDFITWGYKVMFEWAHTDCSEMQNICKISLFNIWHMKKFRAGGLNTQGHQLVNIAFDHGYMYACIRLFIGCSSVSGNLPDLYYLSVSLLWPSCAFGCHSFLILVIKLSCQGMWAVSMWTFVWSSIFVRMRCDERVAGVKFMSRLHSSQ